MIQYINYLYAHVHIKVQACEKAASDLGLGGGFPCALLDHYQLLSDDLAEVLTLPMLIKLLRLDSRPDSTFQQEGVTNNIAM